MPNCDQKGGAYSVMYCGFLNRTNHVINLVEVNCTFMQICIYDLFRFCCLVLCMISIYIRYVVCTLHNGRNDFYKRQFSSLAAHYQSWKLNNLSNFFSCQLTGVTSCLLQFDRNFFCSNNFCKVDCKVSNLSNKIAGKRGQLALIS